ncbi:Hint domain-containing protein [Asaia siamensis]
MADVTSSVTANAASATVTPRATTTTLSTGVWSAVKSGDVTVFTSGTVTVSGPVILGAATLNVTSGAVVDGLVQTKGGIINVQNGGILRNSTLTDGTTNILSGGLTSGNTGDSQKTIVSAGGSSVNDKYATVTGAADTVTVMNGGYITGADLANTTMSAVAGAIVGTFTSHDGGMVRIYSGASVGTGATVTENLATDAQRYKQALLNGSIWSAVNVGGTTVYQSAGITVSGPVVLNATTRLIITSGAVASGVLGAAAGGNPTITVMSGGTLLDSTINAGIVTVSAGGITSANNFNGNTITYATGAKSQDDEFYAVGVTARAVSIQAGATVIGATVETGMTLNAVAGATLSNVVIGSGGKVTSAGASITSNTSNVTISSTLVTSNNQYTNGNISGGNWSAVNISGVTYYQSGAVSLTGPVFLTAANLTITSGATVDGMLQAQFGTPTITVQSGGKLLNSTMNNGYIVVQNGGYMSGNYGNSADVSIASGGSSVNDTFYTTYGGNDTVTVAAGGYIEGPSISNTTLTVSAGATLVQPLNVGAGGIAVIAGVSEACFLAGSMIRTPTGEIAVEDLSIGDEILTLDPRTGATIARPVTWIGGGEIHASRVLAADLSGFPIRVLKDALGDNVPHKDMLVTAEHCLYLDGAFVPVRMLVNGRSVFYDMSETRYRYYHVETAEHSVIWADGVLTESYLDTGNSLRMDRDDTVVRLPKKGITWQSHAAAPLMVDRSVIEPLSRRIEARAAQMGVAAKTIQPALTTDADLHLVTAGGKVIRPARQSNGHTIFMVPSHMTKFRLVSRTSRPVDTIGAFVDDRRELGVLVGEMSVFAAQGSVQLTDHQKIETLKGWAALENDQSRWTTGDAEITLDIDLPVGGSILSVQVLAAGPYLADKNEVACYRITA